MMKSIKLSSVKFASSIFISLLAFDSIAQTPYIIIGDTTSPGITRVNLGNKRILKYDLGYLDYPIDIDNNGKSDLIFKMNLYTGAGAYGSSSSLWTYDQLTIVSGATTEYLINLNSTPHDTTTRPGTMVQVFNALDTLYADSCNDSINFFSYFDHSGSGYSESYIRGWSGSGIHYFGIKKIINNVSYLGWFKINVQSSIDIILMEYAIQKLPVGINELHETTASLYPNPSSNIINISGINCKKIEIYNALGTIVLTEENKNNASLFSVNIQDLKPGMYFTKITEQGKEGYGVKKFIKQ